MEYSYSNERLKRRIALYDDFVRFGYDGLVTGDIAEFGCRSGETAEMLAASMTVCEADSQLTRRLGHPPRRLHLFDTFDGMPESSEENDRASPMVSTGIWRPGSLIGGEEIRKLSLNDRVERVQKRCEQHIGEDQVVCYPGLFEQTMPDIPEKLEFALVHIDSDLYMSAKQVLDYCFEKQHFADGCLLLFDDYYSNKGNPNFGERLAWSEFIAVRDVRYTDFGRYKSDGHAFILHSPD